LKRIGRDIAYVKRERDQALARRHWWNADYQRHHAAAMADELDKLEQQRAVLRGVQ
jgi:hypothetical protein